MGISDFGGPSWIRSKLKYYIYFLIRAAALVRQNHIYNNNNHIYKVVRFKVESVLALISLQRLQSADVVLTKVYDLILNRVFFVGGLFLGIVSALKLD